MEKISQIVRGTARVAATDLKSSSAVRAGTPSFGRPVSESVTGAEHVGTTASRAVELHRELENKRSGKDQVVANIADQFFMTRIRRPSEGEVEGAPDNGDLGQELAASLRQRNEEEMAPPVGYTPRGSFVDVVA